MFMMWRGFIKSTNRKEKRKALNFMQREENFEMRKFVRKFSGVPPKGSVYYLCGSDYSRKLMEMCHNKCLKIISSHLENSSHAKRRDEQENFMST